MLSLFGSYRTRVFAVITVLVLTTAMSISIFQQLQMEEHVFSSEIAHAKNLLKMATVHIENEYDSYLFYRESLKNERKRYLSSIIDLYFVELESLFQKATNGTFSEEVAKKAALDLARRFRYDNGTGYLWVNNCDQPHPILIMHPTMPQIEGQRMDSDDPLFNSALGKESNLFKAIVDVCLENGKGYVDYYWPKPTVSGVSESQLKLSFVKLFKPWNWIVGTGLYLDDIEKDSQFRIEAIIKELRQAFAKIKISENSYLFVFNGNFETLVHPDYGQKRLAHRRDPVAEKALIERMMAVSNTGGDLLYDWKRPLENQSVQKVLKKRAFVSHFAPLDWYIVASLCVDEMSEPLNRLRWKILLMTCILLSFSLLLASMLSANLSRSIRRLAEAAQKIETEGISAVEIPVGGASETQKLGICLKSMLHSLKSSSEERDILFNEIKREEEKHRITLNSIAEAVISTDMPGRILSMNPMAEFLTGWKFEEACDRDINEIYKVKFPERADKVEGPVNRFLTKSDLFPGSERFILSSRNGNEFQIAEHGSHIRNEEGEVKGLVIVFRNVTEENLSQQKLEDAEWKFRALFENGPIAVAYHQMIYDEKGDPEDFYFIDANKNYLELTGVDPRGKRVKEAFIGIENDPFDWIGTFGKVAKTGNPIRFNQYLPLNGRWYDGVAFQYKPDHFVTAFFETTEQRRLEDQLKQAQKMDAIGQLAGGIAHDFNNVLGGIIGAAELLGMRIGDDEKSQKFLRIIQSSSERATDLIGKLLAFGKKKTLSLTPIDAHNAVHEAIGILECSIDKKVDIELSLEAENSIIMGDISQLQNVFINLGINASHAMPDGGFLSIESSCIELEQKSAESYCLEPGRFIKFDVRDTGKGINSEDLQRIFEPFFTTKSSGKGTGLGLAVVFSIIKQHRGTIFVNSEVGSGTVFHILIPLLDQELPLFIEKKVAVQGHGCVLIVDDEEVIRDTLSAILESLGYKVLVAENGFEGVKIFEKNRNLIDLVLLDMVMPIMDGRECFDKLKEIEPEVKVIIASGFSREIEVYKMKEKGLCGFIQKPFSVIDLSVKLKEIISKQ